MPESDVIITDGSVDWSGGVNSLAVTTIQSQRNPNGIKRNELCWLDNASLRDGGITCRNGFTKLLTVHNSTGLFQGKFMYNPTSEDPYQVYSISGHIYLVNIDTRTVIDLTAAFPANVPQFNQAGDFQAFFVQAEQFLVIQAGDGVTLPFIWDGNILRRSNGFTGSVAGSTTPAVTYLFNTTNPWVIPAVGGTVTVDLDMNYPGIIGDIGTWTNIAYTTDPIATFQVMATPAGKVTLQTVSTIAAGAYQYGGYAISFAVGSVTTPPTIRINEIPAAGPMDYFMGRIWYGEGRVVSAGDIVGSQQSGTLAYEYTDSVLKVTENPLVLGGDGFRVPSNDGSAIRAIRHSANIDAALGQGRLFVSTRRAIYAMNVPVTRNDWIAATNNNQPLMTVVQLANGWVNDRSVVAVNGDLFGQSLEPGIRSLNQATRFFQQWGNIQISANETRILKYNDRAYMRYSSGMYFDNRLLETSLPAPTAQGIISKALIPLDFTPISSFNQQRPPNWEGMYEGLDFFQLNTGDFGGRERAFVTVRSQLDASIQLWESVINSRFDYDDQGEKRITWVIEFPAFTWGDETELKRLVGAEIWIDRLFGTVQFSMEYRPDGQACWIPWHIWKKCSTQNSEETVASPAAYPLRPCLESYFSTMTLPKPNPNQCTATGRPSDIAYQFQPRMVIHGFCRVRGLYLHAVKVGRKLYSNLTC